MTQTAEKKSRITIPVLISVIGFIIMKILIKSGIAGDHISSNSYLWFQAILYIFLGGFAIYAFRDDFKEGIGEWKAHPVKSLLWVLGTFVAYYIVEIAAALPMYLLYPDYESINDNSTVLAAEALPMVVGVLALGILGPVTEEAFFRFFGIKKLSGIIPVWLCILISSVAFGFMHVKAFTVPEFLYYLPTIAAAAVWGIALNKSRNITIPLIMHIMINLPAVVVLYLS